MTPILLQSLQGPRGLLRLLFPTFSPRSPQRIPVSSTERSTNMISKIYMYIWNGLEAISECKGRATQHMHASIAGKSEEQREEQDKIQDKSKSRKRLKVQQYD
jgi:hypothetical protein